MFVALQLALALGLLPLANGFKVPRLYPRVVSERAKKLARKIQLTSFVGDWGGGGYSSQYDDITALATDAAAAAKLLEQIKEADDSLSAVNILKACCNGDPASLARALGPLVDSPGLAERLATVACAAPSARQPIGNFEDRALELMARGRFLEAHDVCAGYLAAAGAVHGAAAHGAAAACRLLEGICQAELACADGLSAALAEHDRGMVASFPATLPCGCAMPNKEAVEPFADLAHAFRALEAGQPKRAFGHALAATLAHPALFSLAWQVVIRAGAAIELGVFPATRGKLETRNMPETLNGVGVVDGEASDDAALTLPSLATLGRLVGLADVKARCANLRDAIALDRERGDDLANAPFSLDVHDARRAGARLAMDFGARRTSSSSYVWDPASMWVQPTTVTTESKDLEELEEAVGLTGSHYALCKTKSYSLVLTGSPGTGKSTVAKLYGDVLGELAVLPLKRVVRVTGSVMEEEGVQGLEKLLKSFDRSFAGRALKVGDLVEAQFEGTWGHVGRVVRETSYEGDMGSTKFFGVDFGQLSTLTFRNGTSVPTDQRLTLELPSNCLKSLSERGGVLIIDDAHQLDPTSSKAARQVLDRLGEEMDSWEGRLAVVLVGYEKQIEDTVLAHGGLASRFPRRIKLPDFSDSELVELLVREFKTTKPKYRVSDDKYFRIAGQRVGKGRGATGFGNARVVHALVDLSSERQTQRIVAARKAGETPDIFEFTRNDLLGAPPALLNAGTCLPLRELLQMEGLEAVKTSVNGLLQLAESNAEREELELPPAELSLNRVFLGNPGTGKTTVARLYGLILKELGLLSRGDVVLATPADLVGSALGQSEERTNALLDKSEGCVLVIDEAYGLDPSGGGMGGPGGSGGGGDPYRTAVVDTLVSRVSGDAGADRCVLLLGYRKEMERFLRRGNPGLARRFQLENAFEFEDFDDQALLRILFANVARRGKAVTFGTAKAAVRQNLAKARLRPHFGNAGAVDNLVSSAVARAEQRLAGQSAAARAVQNGLELSDFVVEKPHVVDPSLVLRGLIGCDTIKTRLAEYQAVVEAATAAGRDPTDDLALTFCFQGSPGTGKTTVAKRMGLLFEALGVLPTSEVVTVSASQLSSGFVGQTAAKTRDVFDSARGAVLFIDEAYRLHDTAGRSYMQEAVDEIVNLLTEPAYRGKMVVIFAGYSGQMTDMLNKVNPGLKSRVSDVIEFPDFTASEAAEMAAVQLAEKRLAVPTGGSSGRTASTFLEPWLARLAAAPFWANGRDVDTFVRRVAVECATRKVVEVTAVALDAALATLLAQKGSGSMGVAAPLLLPLQESPFQTAGPVVAAPPAFDLKRAIVVEDVGGGGGNDEGEGDGDDDAAIASALEAALAALGYGSEADAARLVAILSAAVAGAPFPDSIRSAVRAATGKSPEVVDAALRRQARPVLSAVQASVAYVFKRREALRDDVDDGRGDDGEAAIQAQLRLMGPCPMGFDWLRVENGWRCAGGSHFVPDGDPLLFAD